MGSRGEKKAEAISEKSLLSERDIRLLVVVCAELVNLSARLTGRIDPSAAAMLAYVRDDILSEDKFQSP